MMNFKDRTNVDEPISAMSEREKRQALLKRWMKECPDDSLSPEYINGIQRGVTYAVREIYTILSDEACKLQTDPVPGVRVLKALMYRLTSGKIP